jgi:hypothetical protein
LYEKFKEFLSSKGCETYSLYYGVKTVYLPSLKPTRGGWEEYEKMMKELKYNLDNKIDCEYQRNIFLIIHTYNGTFKI